MPFGSPRFESKRSDARRWGLLHLSHPTVVRVGNIAFVPPSDVSGARRQFSFAQEPTRPLIHPIFRWHSYSRLNRPIDCAAAFGPILEGAEIIDLIVAHFLEYLAAQSRAPARGTIEDDDFAFGETLIIVR